MLTSRSGCDSCHDSPVFLVKSPNWVWHVFRDVNVGAGRATGSNSELVLPGVRAFASIIGGF